MSRLALVSLPVIALVVTAVALGVRAAASSAEEASVVSFRVQRSWPLEVPVRPPKQVDLGERAAELAPRWLGTPYRYSGTGPSGFDCSGFTRFVYAELGVDLPHNAAAQFGVGRAIPLARLRRGDLLFFEGLGHVGMYVGRGRMIHAPQTGGHVEIVRLADHYRARLVGARRPVVS